MGMALVEEICWVDQHTTNLTCIKLERTSTMAQESPSLEKMTLRQLRKVASQYNVSRYSRMRKDELLSKLQQIKGEKTANSRNG